VLDGLVGANRIKWNLEPLDGSKALYVYFGRDNSNVGEVQVAVVAASQRPTRALLEPAWRDRGAGSAMPVMIAAQFGSEVWILGPSLNSPLVGPLPVDRATTQLQAVLDEPDGVSARRLAQSIVDAHVTTGEVGFTNQFLFASYYLKKGVPKRHDWPAALELGQHLASSRGRVLIENLGFEVHPAVGAVPNILILRGSRGDRRAVAVLLDETEQFDQKSAKFQISPVAHGLEVAGRENAPWVIVMKQSTLRLYPGRDGVGVGQRGQSETYFELDLNLIDVSFAGLLPMIFSADALEEGGTAEQILSDSGRYAAELGTRLRDRVYKHVVPEIAVAIANRLPGLGVQLDANGLNVAYGLTLRVLFRLIFQAYGEDTGLLPAGRNEGYDANSLQAFISRDLNADPNDYSEQARTIWLDLTQVWDAIYNGNPRWAIPAYGGSLFDPTTHEGRLLNQIELPDSLIGPALQNLLSEQTEDGFRGPVDFRSLQVRDFGTIYEGLLESSLSVAEMNLALDKNEAYVPAQGNDWVVAEGQAYFHSASGDRKATGSYYTPKVVVDYLIDHSVTPALNGHLEMVKQLVEAGKDREAAQLFWDFRVADIAMGSAHFLVAAVDKIERGMRDFLTVTTIANVRSELERLAEKARTQLGRDIEAASEINEAQLLRRQVARRCVYGLDINPLAVELSRLAIWIHTFVPGLPMSSLEHNLVVGNSLTGIATISEAVDSLEVGDLLAPLVMEPLNQAKLLLTDYASATEADKSEVARGAQLLAESKAASKSSKEIFDVALATKIGILLPGSAVDLSSDFENLAALPEIENLIRELNPAHMPLAFPEVFMRANPGFDVLIGNPPWEVIKVEEQKWWGLRIPGVRALPKKQMNERVAAFRAQRPDLEAQYVNEISSTTALRELVTKTFPGLGAGGDPDLYQAFAWRNWKLLRNGGRSSLVLPRMAMSSSSLRVWRAEILENGAFDDVCVLLNTGGWVFAEIDGRYSIALTTTMRTDDHYVKFSGPFGTPEEFSNANAASSRISADTYRGWSETLSLPVMGGDASVGVMNQFYKSPRLNRNRSDIQFRPVVDLHASADKNLYDFDLTSKPGRIPILKGSSFSLWEPDAGGIYAYTELKSLRSHLWTKLQRAMKHRASAYFGKVFTPEQLPLDSARIAFRLITNRTNSRTTVVCLLPPQSTAQHSVQFLFNIGDDKRREAFLLGVMSSIPFDWVSRKWVELNFTFEVLENMPVPVFEDSMICKEIVELAGRLAAIDSRFELWASAVGIPVGSANEDSTKLELIAKLDALVAHAYGLTRDQLEYVFETFHRGWAFKDRLEQVLEYFDDWKGE
jgi:hypothetical protein